MSAHFHDKGLILEVVMNQLNKKPPESSLAKKNQ